MKSINEMTIGELAAFVCSHLRRHTIKAVLSGGACVSIYTDNRYQSYDLDFVENTPTSRKRISEVLSEIGFVEKDRFYAHTHTDFVIDFPAGPLAVGSEPVREIHEMNFSTGCLSLLSPTDCVKDRLAAYYHWTDLQCLEQALLVAEAREINLKEIQRWSVSENKTTEYKEIKSKLMDAAQRRRAD